MPAVNRGNLDFNELTMLVVHYIGLILFLNILSVLENKRHEGDREI